MFRYGKLARVVWYCMVCVTSCGMVCYGMAQCCKVWYGKIMLWYGMACVTRYGTGYGMETGTWQLARGCSSVVVMVWQGMVWYVMAMVWQ